MNRSVWTCALALLVLVALLLAGCESGGSLKIINRTSYPLYSWIRGQYYTVPTDSSLLLDFSTPTQSVFNPDTGVDVEMYLAGETFQIWDAFDETYVDSTTVWINTGKTTQVYADPNRACVKVVNQSTQWIKKIIVQRNTVSTSVTLNYDVYLGPGESWFRQQNPATPTSQFFYLVQVIFENDDVLTFGDNQNILYADDQFLVTVPPQE